MIRLLVFLFYLGLVGAALAQSVDSPPPAGTVGILCAYNTVPPTNTNGKLAYVQCSPTGGISTAPYNYTPLTPGQYNLAIASSTALTIPTGSLQAVVCASGAAVKYTYDGTTTPTATIGMPLALGQCIQFSGATILSNLRFIQTVATATLDVSYTK